MILDEKQENFNKRQEKFIDYQNQLIKIEKEFNDSIKKQSGIIQGIERDFNQKLNLSNNKIDNMENTIKAINDPLVAEEFKENFNRLREKLKEKISKDNLKELYDLNENNVENINNTRYLMSLLKDEIKKVTIDVNNILPKVNSFDNYLIAKKAKKKRAKK